MPKVCCVYAQLNSALSRELRTRYGLSLHDHLHRLHSQATKIGMGTELMFEQFSFLICFRNTCAILCISALQGQLPGPLVGLAELLAISWQAESIFLKKRCVYMFSVHPAVFGPPEITSLTGPSPSSLFRKLPSGQAAYEQLPLPALEATLGCR